MESTVLAGAFMHNLIRNNRPTLIAMCTAKVAERVSHEKQQMRDGLVEAIPLLVDHLQATLQAVSDNAAPAPGSTFPAIDRAGSSALADAQARATLLGRELLQFGYTASELVSQYGELREATIRLAFDTSRPLLVEELCMINRCIDNAVAHAVREFTSPSEAFVMASETDEKFCALMHEIRNAVNTAGLALEVMESPAKKGASSAVLKRSLASMKRLVEDSLVENKIKAIAPRSPTLFALDAFIADGAEAALLESHGKGCSFQAMPVDAGLFVYGDRELLLAALANIVGNAMKFTSPGTEVVLKAYPRGERLLIDVCDHV